MAGRQFSGVIAGSREDQWSAPSQRAVPARLVTGLYRFTKQQPLGAVGALFVSILLILAVFGSDIELGPIHYSSPAPYGYNEYKLGKDRLLSPSADHLMGTDNVGRDIFSRILYGARVSVFIGFGVVVLSTVISTVVTLVSAYYLTTVDLVLQRVIDVVGVMPELVIVTAMMGIYGPTPLTLVVTLGVIRGIHGSRILRSVVIGLRSMPFIEATKALGSSDRRIIFRHLLPNVMYLIIVTATTSVSAAIATETGLAIIGFGLDPTRPSWGNMISASREFLRVAPHMAFFPAAMLALTLFGFRLLGDALRDVLDPRLRGSR